ncbi:BTB/POZ protein [Xylariales sp. AK1849]|nr:BTB/POZ protein [Xylariales sp. AK1849]
MAEPPNKKQRQDAAATTSSTLDQDKEALRSGLFTDVTVGCEDRTWKLHRIILCTRSEWFKAALTKDWAEAKSGEITLQEQNAVAVGWMFTWIYIRVLEPTILEDEETVFGRCIELHKVADFFALDTLCSLCLHHLTVHLQGKVRRVQKAYCEADDKSNFLDDATANHLINAFRRSYQSDFGVFAKLMRKFVDATYYWILSDTKFQAVFDESPRFAVDLAKHVFKQASGTMFCSLRVKISSECDICGKSPWKNECGTWSLLRLHKGVEIRPMCDKCGGPPDLSLSEEEIAER